MRSILKFAVALVFAGLAANFANASLVTYNWVPDTAHSATTSSGTLIYNTSSGAITEFSWDDGSGTVDSYFSQFSVTILLDGDLQIRGMGETSSVNTSDQVQWVTHNSSGADETLAEDLTSQAVYAGDWVEASDQPNPSVPEPATVFSGALLLLPLGVNVLRKLRKA